MLKRQILLFKKNVIDYKFEKQIQWLVIYINKNKKLEKLIRKDIGDGKNLKLKKDFLNLIIMINFCGKRRGK